MRKTTVVLGGLFLCFSLFRVGIVGAEDGTVAQDDRQQLQEQRKEIKGNMEAARAEEKQLRLRIADALQANDTQTAAQLKEQLRAMHQENVQGMQQDKQAMQAAKQEFKNNVQEARQAGDNNPPGPMGGPGTNWENRPGPQGGPGASPDRPGARGRAD
jgi:thioester reductase-like protein